MLANYKNIFIDTLMEFDRGRLNSKDFVIVSDNCWGGGVYKYLKIKYNTPFIGTYLYGDCFIRLLRNFENNMVSKLEFKRESKYGKRENEKERYPIGVIGDDIEIQFLHYKSEEEAYEKWNRRRDRLVNDLKFGYILFFKMDDSNFATKEHFEEFHKLGFKNKVSFSQEGIIKHHHHFEIFLKDEWMSPKNSSYNFDFIHWLNRRKIKKTLFLKTMRGIYDYGEYI